MTERIQVPLLVYSIEDTSQIIAEEVESRGVEVILDRLGDNRYPKVRRKVEISCSPRGATFAGLRSFTIEADFLIGGDWRSVGYVVGLAITDRLSGAPRTGADYQDNLLLLDAASAARVETWPCSALLGVLSPGYTNGVMFSEDGETRILPIVKSVRPLGVRIERGGSMEVMRLDAFAPVVIDYATDEDEAFRRLCIYPVHATSEWQGACPTEMRDAAFSDYSFEGRIASVEDLFWRVFSPSIVDPFLNQAYVHVKSPFWDEDDEYPPDWGYAQGSPEISFARGDMDELRNLVSAAVSVFVPHMSETQIDQVLGFELGDSLMLMAAFIESDGETIPPRVNPYRNCETNDGLLMLVDEILGILQPTGSAIEGEIGDRLSQCGRCLATMWYDMHEDVKSASAHRAIEAAGVLASFLSSHGVTEERIAELLP